MMTCSGCLTKTRIVDAACLAWLKPYPNQTDDQIINIHKIDPSMSTWARDYKIEYKYNCKNK